MNLLDEKRKKKTVNPEWNGSSFCSPREGREILRRYMMPGANTALAQMQTWNIGKLWHKKYKMCTKLRTACKESWYLGQ
jgi:hypothetical protein